MGWRLRQPGRPDREDMLHLANKRILVAGEPNSCPSNPPGRACYIVNLDSTNAPG